METCHSPRKRSKSVLRLKKRKSRLAKHKAEITPLTATIKEGVEEKNSQEEEEEQQQQQTTTDIDIDNRTTVVDSTIEASQDLRPSAPCHSEDSESECPQQVESKQYETICSSPDFPDIPPFTTEFTDHSVIEIPKQKHRSIKSSSNINLTNQRTRIRGKDIVPLKISWIELSRRLNLENNIEQNEKIEKILTYYNIILREDLLPPRSRFEGEEINQAEGESSDDDNASQKSLLLLMAETESCEEESMSSQEELDSTENLISIESLENYYDAEKLQRISGTQEPSQSTNITFNKKLLKSPSKLLENVSKRSKIVWTKAQNSFKFALELKRNSKSFKNSIDVNFENTVGAVAGEKKNNNITKPENSRQDKNLLQLKNKWKQNGKLFRWTLKKKRKETLV